MTTLIEPTDRQLTRVPLTDPEVANQVAFRVSHLAERHAGIFGETQDPRTVRARAEHLSAALARASAEVGAEVARKLVNTLVGREEARGAQFWETALGRVLALHGAFPDQTMTRSQAGAILDVSRQRVGQMLDQGLLEQGRGGFIVTASLVRLLVPA